MKITVLFSDADHPKNAPIAEWILRQNSMHQIELCRRVNEVSTGDVLFLISCSEIVSSQVRDAFKRTFVLHASDLPTGRGWSPHIWALLDGKETITLTLLEAEDSVDTGAIWAQEHVHVPRHADFYEINTALFSAEIRLMDVGLNMVAQGQSGTAQDMSKDVTYLPKRSPADSRIDPHASVASQFNAMRLCDPVRFPAFFELDGHTYELALKKRTKDTK